MAASSVVAIQQRMVHDWVLPWAVTMGVYACLLLYIMMRRWSQHASAAGEEVVNVPVLGVFVVSAIGARFSGRWVTAHRILMTLAILSFLWTVHEMLLVAVGTGVLYYPRRYGGYGAAPRRERPIGFTIGVLVVLLLAAGVMAVSLQQVHRLWGGGAVA